MKMTEVEKDLAILPDHRMTMNHRYDCGHEMANVMSRQIRKKPRWSMKMELFMSKILTIVGKSARICSFVHAFCILFFVIFIEKDIY